MVTVGIDLGGTTIKMGAVRDGQLIASSEIKADSNKSLTAKLPEIAAGVNMLLQGLPVEERKFEGIGLAFPSIVDSRDMKVLLQYVKFSDADELDLKAWAEQTWGVPFVLENDARAALVGEWQYGAGRGEDNIVLCTIGTGFGSAVLMDGKVLKGAHYVAGNLGGHMVVNFKGDKCNCGGIGCLETEASSWVLESKCQSHPLFNQSTLSSLETINYRAVFDHADTGDRLSIEIRDHSISVWAAGIVNLVHAFDPNVVIIGGGVMRRGQLILPLLQAHVDQHTWPPAGTYKIMPADDFTNAGVLGMAYLAGRAVN
ncbi:MAG: ROK family protein [Bacteroidetes bacterium]|nr:MAG: ROK family protein [Bacteroidota bacterium]